MGGPSRARRQVLSRLLILLLILIVTAALLFTFRSQVLSGLNTAWDAVFGALGYGVILVAVMVVLLMFWILWRRQITGFLERGNRALRSTSSSLSLHRWNLWLGFIVFGVAVFGILAFFDLGGGFGLAVVGAADALGALRLVGIILAGVVLIAPRGSWRLVSRAGVALADSYRRYPLHIYLWRAVCWPRDFYQTASHTLPPDLPAPASCQACHRAGSEGGL